MLRSFDIKHIRILTESGKYIGPYSLSSTDNVLYFIESMEVKGDHLFHKMTMEKVEVVDLYGWEVFKDEPVIIEGDSLAGLVTFVRRYYRNIEDNEMKILTAECAINLLDGILIAAYKSITE